MLPIPVLFHLKMNLLKLILQTHFGGQSTDQSSLYYAINFWARKRIARKRAEFHTLEELIIHSFRARIVGLLIAKYRSQASVNTQSLAELELLLRQLGSDELNVLVVNIRAQYEQEYRGGIKSSKIIYCS
jgi:hypothetical protein